MIQRIQSFYLLVVFILCVVLFFTPIAYFKGYIFYIFGVVLSGNSISQVDFIKFLPLIILTFAVAAISISIIFLYKKRHLQIILVRLNILLNTVLVAAIFFFYIERIAMELIAQTRYTVFSAIPILTLVLLILSMGAIYKDEKLVKSADRLR
jgi:hypothetical protein